MVQGAQSGSPTGQRQAQRQHTTIAPAAPQLADSGLLRGVDLALLGIIFLVPLAMGGRQALGQLLLVVLACSAAILWTLAQFRRPTPLRISPAVLLLLLAAIVLVVVQIIPLPQSVLHTVSPSISEMLPMWQPASNQLGGFSDWSCLSLTPAETLDGLMILLAYVLLFVVTVQRVECREDVERMLKWIAISTAIMAIFGLVQYYTSNGKFFWLFQHPFTDTSKEVKGSFTNRNHFAHFIALGIGPFLCCILCQWLRSQHAPSGYRLQPPGDGCSISKLEARSLKPFPTLGRHLTGSSTIALVCLTATVLALLLSKSRGGLVATCGAALICLIILFRAKILGGRFVLASGMIGVVVAALVMTLGEGEIQHRIDDIVSSDTERLDPSELRREIWTADLAAASDFPILGTGVGSHREVYPRYLESPTLGAHKEYTHAESSYINLVLETGMTGLLLSLVGFTICFYWCFRSLAGNEPNRTRSVACAAAIVASLTASLLHAAVDFVWYVPGCVVILIILAGCAYRLYQLSPSAQARTTANRPIPRLVWVTSAIGLACLGFWMAEHKLSAVIAEYHWHTYLQLALTPHEGETDADARKLRSRKRSALASAVQADPHDYRIQLHTAKQSLKHFHAQQRRTQNALTVDQLRAASVASRFATLDELNAWLNRAIGENRESLDAALLHCRRSLQLCPLQGEAYLLWAELSFLEGAGDEVYQACLQQALAVRPHDAQVLFATGRAALMAGNVDQAIHDWQKAFVLSPAYQTQIINVLAGRVPAQFFIENFQPDRKALQRLCDRYRTIGHPEEYHMLLEHYAQACVERAKETSDRWDWFIAQKTYGELQRPQSARRCLESALRDNQNSFEVRYRLGMWLFGRKHFAEAAKHLTWCVDRKPRDRKLKQRAELAAKEGLRGNSRFEKLGENSPNRRL